MPQKVRKDTSGAIYRLWEDPGEQKNLIRVQTLSWIKSEVNSWMRKELEGAPLPVTSDNNVNHSMFFRKLMPNWKNNEIYDIYQ